MHDILAEIITIGDEILIGQIVDTNSAWLGQELNTLGIKVKQITSISDDASHIKDALNEAKKRVQIIILTGGLGPTKDDITKKTLAEYFNCQLILHEPTLKHVEYIFRNRKMPMLESNILQAYVPENCEVLANQSGTAPGMWFDHDQTIYISMPGVPFEMKSIFSEQVIPKLKSKFSFPSITHRTILTAGIGESFLAEKIKELENNLPQHIKLAYLPSLAQVRLRFSAYGEHTNELEFQTNQIVENLYDLISYYIYGEGNTTLEIEIGKLLKQNKQTLSCAESYTGGYLSHLITSVPGSSAYFMGSIVSYDNDIKINKLGVQKQTIIDYGAVSEKTIIEMAEGCLHEMNTDFAIATSGVAGPGGGTKEKPVGMCWIAVAQKNGNTISKLFHMGDDRNRTIQRSGVIALDLLRKVILNIPIH